MPSFQSGMGPSGERYSATGRRGNVASAVAVMPPTSTSIVIAAGSVTAGRIWGQK